MSGRRIDLAHYDLDPDTAPIPDAEFGRTLYAGPSRGFMTPDQLSDHEDRKRVVAAMCSVLREGNTVETAAGRVHLRRRLLYDWMTRGARGEPGYDELLAMVDEAKAEAVAKRETRQVQLADQNENLQAATRANEFILMHLAPSQWGPVQPPDARKLANTILAVFCEHVPADLYARCVDSLSRRLGGGTDALGPADGPIEHAAELVAEPEPVCAGVLGPAPDGQAERDPAGNG